MPAVRSDLIEVCVFKFEQDRPLYLLLRRSNELAVYPGIWQLVSGRLVGGEKAVDAALRELKEETGLTPIAFWITPFVNSFYNPADDSIHMSPFFAAQVEIGEAPRLSDEHSAFGWFGFGEAAGKLVWPGQREGLRVVEEYVVRGEACADLTRLR
jgi:dATP pyrophosphohydrolase